MAKRERLQRIEARERLPAREPPTPPTKTTAERLDGNAFLYCGDCTKVLPRLRPSSIDSCVTDPPYHLQSIHKRFAAKGRDETSERYAAGPYGRHASGFMGMKWDGGGVAFDPATWVKVYQVLKPGAHLLAFGGTRTFHRMACAIEDAGFEIRDCVLYLYGSGFPKSHDIAKDIDRAVGAKRKKIGKQNLPGKQLQRMSGAARNITDNLWTGDKYEGPISDEAKQWDGWGTALKPACEIIVVARKPLSEKNVAANVLKWGTGALNVDGCRVSLVGIQEHWKDYSPSGKIGFGGSEGERTGSAYNEKGRWPANVIHDGSTEVLASFPDAPGQRGDVKGTEPSVVHGTVYSGARNRQAFMGPKSRRVKASKSRGVSLSGSVDGSLRKEFFYDGSKGRWPANVIHDGSTEVLASFPETDPASARPRHNGAFDSVAKGYEYPHVTHGHADDGGSVGRFFYTAKADADDRIASRHPSVKPIDLLRYLVRLVTPPGGVVLDLFAGTGTTGEAAFLEGFRSVLIEREEQYQQDIRTRMATAFKPQRRNNAIAIRKAEETPLPKLLGGSE